MDSSGTRMSEIEDYLKSNVAELHVNMANGGVSLDLIANTDSLTLSLIEFFLSSLTSEEVAKLQELEFEIIKRNISINIAQTVVFACQKVTSR